MSTREELNKDLTKEIENEEKSEKRKKLIKIFSFIIIILVIVLSLSYVILTYVGNSGLIVREYQIKSSAIPSSFDGIKIVHFSDIHYGPYLSKKKIQKVVNAVNRTNADIVIFTGDFVEKDYKITNDEKEMLIESFKSIEANLGKYAILGEVDGEISKEIFASSDFRLLDNASQKVYKEDYYIDLIAFSSDYENADLASDEAFKIVLTHKPDNAQKIIELLNPDLILAGHSHNGQIRLPFIGAIVKKEGAKTYYDNYYEIGNTKLFISSGIGNSRYDMRLFNHPSINFYRLK